MFSKIDFDPKIHKIIPGHLPDFLRRITRLPNLVVYRHMQFMNFVVALRSARGDQLVEIAFVNSQNPSSLVCTADDVSFLLKRLRNFVTVKQAKQQLRDRMKYENNQRYEAASDIARGIKGVRDYIHRKYGAVKAETYQHSTGHSDETLQHYDD